MPKTIQVHESWCTKHNDEVEQMLCVGDYFQFGPPDKDEHAEDGDRVGYVYLWQHEEDEHAELNIFYPTEPHRGDAAIPAGALRMLVAALDEDPDGLAKALHSALADIDKEPT